MQTKFHLFKKHQRVNIKRRKRNYKIYYIYGKINNFRKDCYTNEIVKFNLIIAIQ